MKHLCKHIVIAVALFFTSNAFAAGYKHQIEGSFHLDNRTFEADSGADLDMDIFNIIGTYRNQYQKDLFIVGNFELMNGGYDYLAFSGGAEWNFIKDKENMEAGAGGLFRIFTGDVSGFGIKPYGFIRNYLTSNLFVSGVLGYDLAFVDFNDADGDFKGIQITAGLGYAF